MTWQWDNNLFRYRDGGRFLSREKALALALESINATNDATSLLSDWVHNGRLSPDDWRDIFRQEIKGEYIRQYIAGRGGRQNMSFRDWGLIGADLKKQYGFLDNFTNELNNLSEAEIRARMQLYINSAHQANEKGHAEVAKAWGADTVDWMLDPFTKDHCETCEQRSKQGPQPIADNGGFPDIDGGVFPGDGTSICMSNDRCNLVFSNSKTGKTFDG